ncbi:chromate transporter [Vagococcus salmoninarum]|uniref:chromate transporter n=1 Tax=Vagococcus salmoninarum TaxID=2739 RepID=UPI00187F7AC4|nr:chromate transporter [Vagococcus salmoninarum]MBE9389771.1 chromate transporter [Vagococcus salmoninarum]
MYKNLNLFKRFFLASTFTFSGGLAMVPMLHQELVTDQHYLSSEDFYHYVSLAQTVPGVTVITTACLLGEKVNGKAGRFFASLGAITPVLVIMNLLTMLYQSLPQGGIMLYVLTAIRGTAGIFILEAGIGMFPYIVKKRPKAWLLVFLTILAITIFHVPIGYILSSCFLLAVFSRKEIT